MENTRFMFRAWVKEYGRFIERRLIDGHEASLTWEQCTGLKDKNGKLIYENDIVTDGKEVGRIYWYKTGWAVTMFLWQHDISELEVIGNIHENPELLEDKA